MPQTMAKKDIALFQLNFHSLLKKTSFFLSVHYLPIYNILCLMMLWWVQSPWDLGPSVGRLAPHYSSLPMGRLFQVHSCTSLSSHSFWLQFCFNLPFSEVFTVVQKENTELLNILKFTQSSIAFAWKVKCNQWHPSLFLTHPTTLLMKKNEK